MEQYTKEWCRTFWNAMRFMEAAYTRLERSGVLKTGFGWGAGRDEEDPDDDENSASVYIECRPLSAKKQQMHLGIYFSIDPEGPENGYPLWIVPWRDDAPMLKRLEDAFAGNVVWEGDDFCIGLPLEIPAGATEVWIVAEGNRLADRIIGVLVP